MGSDLMGRSLLANCLTFMEKVAEDHQIGMNVDELSVDFYSAELSTIIHLCVNAGNDVTKCL